MADPGIPNPPDPGGAQRGAADGLTGVWPAATFASVIKAPSISRFPKISLAARQYGVKDGKPAISFSTAELKAGEEFLRFTLVAKFSQGRPHIEDIRKAFLSGWNLKNNCSIGAWDARHILIVLDNEGDARKVLAHPLRKVGHSLFRVFRWSKDFNLKKEPSTTSTWIRLPSLPPQMYNPGYIDAIVSSFGKFLAVDNRTTSFINPCFARACVEVDTTSKLPDEVWISTGKDEGFWQRIEFENKLLFCSKCKLHGHALSNCRKVKASAISEKTQVATPPAAEDLSGGQILSLDPHRKEQTEVAVVARALMSQTPGNEKQVWTLVQSKKQRKKDKKNATVSLPLPFGKSEKDMGDHTLMQETVPYVAPKGNKKQNSNGGQDGDQKDMSPAVFGSTRLPPTHEGTPNLLTFEDQKRRMEKAKSKLDESVLLNEKAPERISSSLNIRAAPFIPGQSSDNELSDEEWIPARKVKQLRKMEKQRKTDKDKLEKIKESYNSLISDLDNSRSQSACNLSQANPTLPPLTMYSRTRDLDVAYVSKHDDDPHYFRRANPYID